MMAARVGIDALPGSGRARAFQGWLGERADKAVGRLALQWFRAHFAASRNSGCAASIHSAFSVLPSALVVVAILYAPGGQTNVFAQRSQQRRAWSHRRSGGSAGASLVPVWCGFTVAAHAPVQADAWASETAREGSHR
jgi:hypothetical protein